MDVRQRRFVRSVRISLGALAAVSVLGASGATAAVAAPASPEWDQLQTQKADYLKKLGTPIKACIGKYSVYDKKSPLFHSCIDWHSSVHAHWAHYALAHRSNDASYAAAANNSLKPALLEQELEYMKKTVSNASYENPYGFAWFLRLARERERATGDQQLRPLATFAATKLKERLTMADPAAYYKDMVNGNYANLSWGLINYYEWANHVGDKDAVKFAQGLMTHWKSAEADKICSLNADAKPSGDTYNYLPGCLLRYAAVSVVEGDSAKQWIAAKIPENYEVQPYPNKGGEHSNALNFSRGFALIKLGAVTQRESLRENGAKLVNYQMRYPKFFANNYASNGHWIAQIGVLAIDASY